MSSADSQIFVIRDERTEIDAISAIEDLHLSGEWTVEISPKLARRTKLQNNWYFEILSQICEATGFDKEALHIWMKKEFLGLNPQTIWDQQINVTKSTTKLTVKQMSEYISQVERFCAEKGIELIYPNYWQEIHR